MSRAGQTAGKADSSPPVPRQNLKITPTTHLVSDHAARVTTAEFGFKLADKAGFGSPPISSSTISTPYRVCQTRALLSRHAPPDRHPAAAGVDTNNHRLNFRPSRETRRQSHIILPYLRRQSVRSFHRGELTSRSVFGECSISLRSQGLNVRGDMVPNHLDRRLKAIYLTGCSTIAITGADEVVMPPATQSITLAQIP